MLLFDLLSLLQGSFLLFPYFSFQRFELEPLI